MPVILYRSWRDFPLAQWRWSSFSPEELRNRDKDDPQLIIDLASLDRLQQLRDFLGHPVIVVSAGRTHEWNKAVGGAPGSYHLKGMAFDVAMDNQDPVSFEAAARACGFNGFGYYPNAKRPFMHIDTGPPRSWGKPFPKRPRKVVVAEVADEAKLPEDEVNERFAPEAPKPTIIEALAKPEVIGPTVGTAATGFLAKFGDVLATSLPLQIAVGLLLVAVPVGLGWWFFVRARAVRQGD